MKSSTINKKEIEKFSKIAEEWWNPEGKFKPLHKFNPIRISYIKENIISTFKIKEKIKPLKRLRILDIGCGGGLLSEPMSRLGADVVGIDASSRNIEIAKLHAKKNNLTWFTHSFHFLIIFNTFLFLFTQLFTFVIIQKENIKVL